MKLASASWALMCARLWNMLQTPPGAHFHSTTDTQANVKWQWSQLTVAARA